MTTDSGSDDVRGVRDQSVNLPCAASADGSDESYVLEWKKDGAVIFTKFSGASSGHAAPNFKDRLSAGDGNSLLLSQIRDSDEGLYQCELKLLNRSSHMPKGRPLRLSVQTLPHFAKVPPVEVYKNVGDMLTLECEADSKPSPSVTWTRGSIRLENSSRVIMTRSQLHINRLEAGDAGKYHCVARNSVGLRQTETTLIFATKPKFTTKPSDSKAREGLPFKWRCQAHAQPDQINYRWYYKDKQIIYANSLGLRSSVEEDGTLHIHKVSLEDNGPFTCVASNGYGEASASATLNVQYAPKLLPTTKSIQVLPLGYPGWISCDVDSNPPVSEVVWTKATRVLTGLARLPQASNPQASSGRLYLSHQDQRLNFQKVISEDKGVYTCQAFNSLPDKSSPFEIHVSIAEPPVFIDTPELQYIREPGDSVELRCAGAGNPKPTVSWHRVDGSLIRAEQQSLNPGQIRLVWKSLSAADHGYYECLLQNTLTKITAKTYLIIKNTPPQAPQDISVDTGPFDAKVSWKPGFNGGHKQGFLFKHRNPNKRLEWSELNLTESQTSYYLTNLSPDTKYQLQIHPWNSLGFGFPSPIIILNTKGYEFIGTALPTDVYGVTYFPDVQMEVGLRPLPPRNLAITERDDHVSLDWEPPLHSGIIQFYLVEYKKTPKNKRNLVAAAPSGEATVSDGFQEIGSRIKHTNFQIPRRHQFIESGEMYDVRVRARSIVSLSEPSNVVTYRMPGVSSHTALIAGVAGGILFFIICLLLACIAAHMSRQRHKAKQNGHAKSNGQKQENGGYAHVLDEIEYPTNTRTAVRSASNELSNGGRNRELALRVTSLIGSKTHDQAPPKIQPITNDLANKLNPDWPAWPDNAHPLTKALSSELTNQRSPLYASANELQPCNSIGDLLKHFGCAPETDQSELSTAPEMQERDSSRLMLAETDPYSLVHEDIARRVCPSASTDVYTVPVRFSNIQPLDSSGYLFDMGYGPSAEECYSRDRLLGTISKLRESIRERHNLAKQLVANPTYDTPQKKRGRIDSPPHSVGPGDRSSSGVSSEENFFGALRPDRFLRQCRDSPPTARPIEKVSHSANIRESDVL